MVRMMTYKEANQILGCALSPNYRCICKKTAIANRAQENPLAPFTQNRLVPVKTAGMAHGVAKKHHVVILDENGGTIYDLWMEDGAAIPNPGHPAKEGYDPAGWSPSLPATATQDGVYRRQYTIKAYTITFIGKDGQTLPNSGTYTYGQAIVAPDPQTPSGWAFDGWNPAVPATATANGTYYGQYHQSTPDVQPDDDTPVRPDDPDKKGRDGYAYTMDQMYQAYRPDKPTPQTSIAQWAPIGGGWWSGPMDGFDKDSKYGEDNGICARRLPGRDQANRSRFFKYDSDGCVYEYAKPTSSQMHSGTVDVDDLLSYWECDCYDSNNNYMGKYTITSNDSWIKFIVEPGGYDIVDITVPFVVSYYIDENRDGGPARKGTVTVTTPGGVSHYDANYGHKGLPYIENGITYFYQQSAAESYDTPDAQ